MKAARLLVAAAAACGSSSTPSEEARLASLTFEVPAMWKRSDVKERGLLTAQWEPTDNERKESITIIRSERVPGAGNMEPAALQQLLAISQRSLRDVRASKVIPIRTQRGLVGARVDVSFVPQGLKDRYSRVHVVVADHDHDALVHVLYTAKNADTDQRALELVLSSIRHEEG
jgi:hypothetical protein